MPITLNSFTPNTKAESAKVNTNFTNLKTAVENASYRAFGWGLVGSVIVGDEQGMKWLVPQDLTVTKMYVKTGSGTCDIRIQKDTTNVLATFSASNSIQSTTSFDSITLTAGQVLTLDVLAISSAVDLFVILDCQVSANI